MRISDWSSDVCSSDLSVQDHVLHTAQAHIDRIVLEAFVAGIDACEDEEARRILGMVCDIYALSVIEDDKAWFIEHRRSAESRVGYECVSTRSALWSQWYYKPNKLQ